MNFDTTQEEYIDELTGVRMIVKHDHPVHPLIAVMYPEQLSFEQVNGALSRLRHRAGITPAQFPDPYPA